MKKLILVAALIFVLPSLAFGIDNRLGVGLDYNFNSTINVPGTGLSLKGIFSNIAVEISSTRNNVWGNDSDGWNGQFSDNALSLSYIFDYNKNIALEAGVEGLLSSYVETGEFPTWKHSSGLGIVLGAEYLLSKNFGIGIRVVPIMSITSDDSYHSSKQTTMLGYGTVGAYLYL